MGRLKRSVDQIAYDIQHQEKECCVCNIRKPFSEFYNYKNKSDGKSYRCKPCDDIARFKWKKDNPERSKRSSRERSLKFRFGINLQEYEELLHKQNYACAICGSTETRNMGDTVWSLSVDHNHITGKIRGLLCNNCNRGLGLLGDSLEALKKAIKYLEETLDT